MTKIPLPPDPARIHPDERPPLSHLGQEALRLALQRWQVFPLAPRSKIPFPGSHGHKDATDDEDAIRRWWTEHPEANIGVAAGDLHAGGSGVWSLDFDRAPGKDGLAVLDRLVAEHGGPLGGLELITSRGKQIIFQWDERCPASTRSGIEPGVDVRSNGGYFVAPPSVHPTGAIYRWGKGTPGPAPDWLCEWIAQRSPATFVPPSHGAAAPTTNGTRPYSEEAYDEYRQMLGFVMGREHSDWVRVGFAIYELGWGEQGFRLWDAWSRNWPDCYDPAKQRSDWWSFGRGYAGERTTIASIVQIAMHNGWTQPLFRRFNPQTAGDLFFLDENWPADDEEQVPWLVPDLIPEGMSIVAALAKHGKSQVAVHLALAMSSENGVVFGKHRPPRPLRVLYVAKEGERWNFRAYRDAVRRGESWGPTDGRLAWATPGDYATRYGLDEANGEQMLRTAILEHRADVVILETLRRFFPGEENDSTVTARVYAAIMRLRSATGASFIVTAHAKKAFTDVDWGSPAAVEAAAIRGSGDIMSMCDAAFCLAKLASSRTQLLLRFSRTGRLPPIGPFELSIEYEGGGQTIRYLDQPALLGETENRWVANLLAEIDVRGELTTGAAEGVPGVSKSRRSELIRDLVQRGVLEQVSGPRGSKRYRRPVGAPSVSREPGGGAECP